MKKELVFSITKEDFDFTYLRGSGNGGQKKQKTSSACRCYHRESGAVGYSEDSRSQSANQKTAFTRCINTQVFKVWFELEKALRLKGQNIDNILDQQMQPENIKIEVFNGDLNQWEEKKE